jgi:hypothetical protein
MVGSTLGTSEEARGGVLALAAKPSLLVDRWPGVRGLPSISLLSVRADCDPTLACTLMWLPLSVPVCWGVLLWTLAYFETGLPMYAAAFALRGECRCATGGALT